MLEKAYHNNPHTVNNISTSPLAFSGYSQETGYERFN